jgi:hypothetical protein
MIVFILCNLLLAFLNATKSEILTLLTTPIALGIGIAAMICSLLFGYFKKVSSIIWHDGFCSSTILVWYAYWQPQFEIDTPMFLFFPLYFAILTSIVTLGLINKSPYFDRNSIENLRYLNKMLRFNIPVSIGFVLIGLVITRHYTLFPMAMTYFIVRHAMIVCLEIIDGINGINGVRLD